MAATRVWAALGLAALPLAAAFHDPASAGDFYPYTEINLPFTADEVAFRGDGQRVLLVSQEQQRIFLFDLDSKEILRDASIGGSAVRQKLTDFVIGPDGRYAYVLGRDESGGAANVTRVDTESFDRQERRLPGKFFSPSLAVGADETIFISDPLSSAVFVVDKAFTEPSDAPVEITADPQRNIFLKLGGAVDVEASTDGRFAFVSYDSASKVSAIDVGSGEVVDDVGWAVDDKDKIKLSMLVLDPTASDAGLGQTSLIVADVNDDVVVEFALDASFRELNLINFASLGFGNETREGAAKAQANGEVRPPLLLSADLARERIVVGSRYEGMIVAFSRFGNTFERRNVMLLDTLPLDVDLSPDGNMLVALDSSANKLKLLSNPFQIDPSNSVILGSERIREAQKALAVLGYSVGVVDGFDGPATRRAVERFQKEQGLEMNGRIDERILKLLKDAAAANPRGGAQAD